MSAQSSGMRAGRASPLRLALSEWRLWRKDRTTPHYRLANTPPDYQQAPVYPIDMSPLLELPFGRLDAAGVLYNEPDGKSRGAYQPTSIAQYALANWNRYLETGEDSFLTAFMRQAYWLLSNETLLDDSLGVWPIPFTQEAYSAQANWVSALTQGNVISTLLRAFIVTKDEAFMRAARRATGSFERDVVEWGVAAPVGADGVFFEEVAVYPASHILNGFILALFGLYDYVALTGDAEVKSLIDRSLRTLHTMLDEYDLGFWTRYSLHDMRPASRFYHALHVTLLRALAWYSGCEHCAALAERWDGYQRSRIAGVRYWFASRKARYVDGARRWLRKRRMRRLSAPSDLYKSANAGMAVCAPITSFPVAGGMRGVLSNVASAMAGQWRIDYLTHHVGQHDGEYTIHAFGGRLTSPWRFPTVWLYYLAGRRKLNALLAKRGDQYQLLLPQDGAFTGAFAALIARRRGIRVVCMDHGNLTWPFSPVYRAERARALKTKPWLLRPLYWLGSACYISSLGALARITARHADHFLVAGDEVYEALTQHLNVRPRHITRYPYVVDMRRFAPPDRQTRSRLRAEARFNDDDVVVTMINRLAPEKGMDVALDGLRRFLAQAPAPLAQRVHLMIAGDGPSRGQVESDMRRLHLEARCHLVGEARPQDAARLLSISDIFLYTGTRGTNYSMAVLEAMAAGLPVIASTEPRSNAALLGDGKGIAIPVNDAEALSSALGRLCADPVARERMGRAAREYVVQRHSAEALRYSLLRASFWSVPVTPRMPPPTRQSPISQLEETGAS
jgi:glycosyltransferase involved in cell wall biosynthesis